MGITRLCTCCSPAAAIKRWIEGYRTGTKRGRRTCPSLQVCVHGASQPIPCNLAPNLKL